MRTRAFLLITKFDQAQFRDLSVNLPSARFGRIVQAIKTIAIWPSHRLSFIGSNKLMIISWSIAKHLAGFAPK
jgi:hypothetical protein